MPDRFEIGWLKEREDHAATQGFVGGLLLGTLLGIVLALVFAPRRGEETRAAVANKAVDARDLAVNLVTRSKDAEPDLGAEAAIEREIGAEDAS